MWVINKSCFLRALQEALRYVNTLPQSALPSTIPTADATTRETGTRFSYFELKQLKELHDFFVNYAVIDIIKKVKLGADLCVFSDTSTCILVNFQSLLRSGERTFRMSWSH
ncbi:unnamed protein product [Boreogadus saida]